MDVRSARQKHRKKTQTLGRDESERARGDAIG